MLIVLCSFYFCYFRYVCVSGFWFAWVWVCGLLCCLDLFIAVIGSLLVSLRWVAVNSVDVD